MRDRLYLWTHPAGSHNGYYLGPNTHVDSRMTPAEAALYLGISNVYFAPYFDDPPLWRYRQHAIALRPMNEVIWALTGVGAKTSPEMRARVLELGAEFPNISGFVLDDFFRGGERTVHHEVPQWLAENDVSFPVTLSLKPPRPTRVEVLEIVQTDWVTLDYRTKDIVVEARRSGRTQIVVDRSLQNIPGDTVRIDLPAVEIDELLIKILSTHDEGKARSCGLKEVRVWNDAVPIRTAEEWTASASSTYSPTAHAPRYVFLTAWPPAEPTTDSRGPVPATMGPDEVAALRGRTEIGGRRLPIVCGIFTNQITPRIMDHVKFIDKVILWTWVASDLAHLDSNLERLERIIAPTPIILGCNMFDYGRNAPLNVSWMQHQCELGLRWLREGRLDSMVFHASSICDQDLAAVQWAREWVARVGPSPL